MLQPGRKYSSANGYRYAFNGKENDKDVAGDGNEYDYGFRIYNSRIARFLSVDPLTKSYPFYSPYQFAGNMPISAIDIDGKEPEITIDKEKKEIYVVFKYTYNDATVNVLKQQNLSLNDLHKGFDYYYKPGEDGNTQATTDALSNTQKSKEQLEALLGGKIASGGTGYFNVDYGDKGTFKVFCTLQISNTFSKKETAVRPLEAHQPYFVGENAEQDETGIHLTVNNLASPESIGRLFSHEVGHEATLPDYSNIPDENPFKSGNGSVDIQVKNPNGKGTSTWGVMELMAYGGGFKILSSGSIEKIVKQALDAAYKQKKNKITLIGGVLKQNAANPPMRPKAFSSSSKPKIIKKE